MAGAKRAHKIREILEDRAAGYGEYCKANVAFSPNPFTIDHIIPISAGGTDELDNLAYACFGCNCSKYQSYIAIDPFTQIEVPLFNPRKENWDQHFVWDADAVRVLGLTPVGRATVHRLKLNRPELIRMREGLIAVNRHPPE